MEKKKPQDASPGPKNVTITQNLEKKKPEERPITRTQT